MNVSFQFLCKWSLLNLAASNSSHYECQFELEPGSSHLPRTVTHARREAVALWAASNSWAAGVHCSTRLLLPVDRGIFTWRTEECRVSWEEESEMVQCYFPHILLNTRKIDMVSIGHTAESHCTKMCVPGGVRNCTELAIRRVSRRELCFPSLLQRWEITILCHLPAVLRFCLSYLDSSVGLLL